MANYPAKLAGAHRVTVRRVVPATIAEVYELWTNAERMPEWILDGGSATLDLRVGGKYHMDMHYQGRSYPHDGEYLEIGPPNRLVFTWISEGTNWLPSIVTVELSARGEETEVVITHDGLPENTVTDHEGGWAEILGWLDRVAS